MKIKVHGSTYEKKEQNEDFKCENCGCEFSVKEDEYYTDVGGADAISSNTYYCNYSFSNDYYVCSCPECHKIVKKKHQRTTLTSVKNDGDSCKADLTYVQVMGTSDDNLSEMLKG